jgi:CMP-N-acetylneuraminic acid synthetase
MRKLNGKPLIYYKIKECLKIKGITVLVSTDCKKIALFAKNNGAYVPFLRNKKYATSKSSTTAVILETLRQMKKRNLDIPNFIGILPPTNPFLKSSSILKAYKKIKRSKKVNSILTFTKSSDHPFNVINMQKKMKFDVLKINNKKYSQFERTQDWPKVFISSPALKISKKNYFLKMIKNISPLNQNKTFDINSCTGKQISKIESFDINNLEDFQLADYFAKKNLL